MATVGRGAMALVFVVLLCDIISFSIMLPMLPSIVGHYAKIDGQTGLFKALLGWAHAVRPLLPHATNHTEGDALDVVLMGGLLGTLASVPQLLSSGYLFGRWADKYGRKPAILLSEALTLVALAMWGFAAGFPLFVASRMMGGFCRGLTLLSQTVAADVSTAVGRTGAMAWVGAALSGGFVLGPFLGTLFLPARLASSDALLSLSQSLEAATGNPFALPAAASAAFALLGTLVALCLPETRHLAVDPKTTAAAAAATAAAADATAGVGGQRRAEWLLRMAHLAFLVVFAGAEFNLSFFTADRFGFSPADNGKMLALIGGAAVAIQGGYVRRIKAPADAKNLASTGIVALLVALLLFAWAPTKTWLMAGAALFAFASASVSTTMTSLCSMVVPAERRGKALGHFRAFGLLGRSIGPLLCSFLYWSFGPAVAFGILSLLLLVPAAFIDLFGKLLPPAAKSKPE